MLDFFSAIFDTANLIIDYFVGLITSLFSYITILIESSVFLSSMLGHLPVILQICGQFVISVAIFKAIFGRQGAS